MTLSSTPRLRGLRGWRHRHVGGAAAVRGLPLPSGQGAVVRRRLRHADQRAGASLPPPPLPPSRTTLANVTTIHSKFAPNVDQLCSDLHRIRSPRRRARGARSCCWPLHCSARRTSSAASATARAPGGWRRARGPTRTGGSGSSSPGR
jgi:hypothetical protein